MEKRLINEIFTDEELAMLKLTPEEVEIFEDAEIAVRSSDACPQTDEEIDEFFAKFDKYFPENSDFNAIMENFAKLPETDPKFLSQFYAMNVLKDCIEEVQPAEVKSVSSKDIAKEKEKILSDERKKKLEDFQKRLSGK